ncbi:uncharacterized protein EMH_0076270 [Eimeria mitis]|uniref:Uncharacterized protein n=1 Tax=Eimeria mitis TaxID=44415 RepID=U6KAT2_9EIME|nr:uncharacterized protein EMH_0076270 [Eimeria mitis]CDJ32598.1 hypothetical protein EMH_0076270 [Eimeria mitis]
MQGRHKRNCQRRLNSGAAVQRSLSDAEDEQERSEILEHCLDLEQEFGVQPAVSEYVEEASEAKSRLAAMLYDSAATFERMRAVGPQMLQDEAQPPPPKLPRLNESSPSTSHSEASFRAFWQRGSGAAVGGVVSALDPDAWTPEDPTVGVGGGAQQSQTAKLEELLGIQWGVSTSPVGPSAVYELNADVGQASAVRPIQTTPTQQVGHHTGPFYVTVKLLGTSPAAQAVPATSSGGGEPCEATDISLHPFVRLPAVNPKDVRRSFHAERALAPYFGRSSPMDSYVRMRSLFAKASLTPEEAEALMLEAEKLSSYAIDKLTREVEQEQKCWASLSID